MTFARQRLICFTLDRVCRFRVFNNILMNGQKMTDAFTIRNRWRFVCKLLLQMVENHCKLSCLLYTILIVCHSLEQMVNGTF